VHPLRAAIAGQPCNSIIICKVQLGRATSQLCQHTGIDDVRHRLWLSTGTQVRVGLSPSLPADTAVTPRSAEAIQERPWSIGRQGRSKPGCRIVRLTTNWEMTTEAELQSFHH